MALAVMPAPWALATLPSHQSFLPLAAAPRERFLLSPGDAPAALASLVTSSAPVSPPLPLGPRPPGLRPHTPHRFGSVGISADRCPAAGDEGALRYRPRHRFHLTFNREAP